MTSNICKYWHPTFLWAMQIRFTLSRTRFWPVCNARTFSPGQIIALNETKIHKIVFILLSNVPRIDAVKLLSFVIDFFRTNMKWKTDLNGKIK